jgi:DNA-binding MarR family transcriptional regulator
MKPMKSAALQTADYHLLAHFRHHIRRFLAFSETAARRAGLTAQQHQALLAIRASQEHGTTIGDLAKWIGIRPHSAVGLINRLVRGGWIDREQGKQDRRQVFLYLTRKGERVLSTLSLQHRSELSRLGPILRAILTRIEKTAPKPKRWGSR